MISRSLISFGFKSNIERGHHDHCAFIDIVVN